MDIVQYPWYQSDVSLYCLSLLVLDRSCIQNFQLKPLIFPLHPIWRFEDIAKSILCNTGILQQYFFFNSPWSILIRNDERNTQGGFNDCEMQICGINYITWKWNQYPGVIYILLTFNYFNEAAVISCKRSVFLWGNSSSLWLGSLSASFE